MTKYVVIDFVDNEIYSYDSLEEARETAELFVRELREMAKRDGEWAECSEILICQVISRWSLQPIPKPDWDTEDDEWTDLIEETL